MDYFRFAADLARLKSITYSPTCDPSNVSIDALTISAAPMPNHYVARAIVLDLQPAQMVRAIAAVEERIRAEFPSFHRTGWRAACDGLYLHFSAATRVQNGPHAA